MERQNDEIRQPRFVFVLQPEFPMNAMILASEALRIANQNSGRRIFDWHMVSERGQPVRASNGMWVTPDAPVADLHGADVVLVFEGNLPTQHNSPSLLGALRTAHRFGATVIGIDTGAFALAQAGILGSTTTTLHWEAMPAYLERFPATNVRDCLFHLEGKSGNCAGGVATLDLMLWLIASLRGRLLADEVADALVHSRRERDAPQRAGSSPDIPVAGFQRRVIQIMEQNLDFPLPPAGLARDLRMSVRSLERNCRRYFGQTPQELYLNVRLQAARNLLFYEELSVKAIANACGFSYPSVFTRAFVRQFGLPPIEFRKRLRQSQEQKHRPEIQRLSKERFQRPIPAVSKTAE